jgi:UrcA family protein
LASQLSNSQKLVSKYLREEIMKESKLLKGLIASVAVVALSAPAIASASNDTGLAGNSVKVNYSDLNVQKKAGAKVLYRRLQRASKEVCGVEALRIAGSVRILTEMQICYRNSLTTAVAKVDSAALTKIHES